MIRPRAALLGLALSLVSSFSLADEASCKQCVAPATSTGACMQTEAAVTDSTACQTLFDCYDQCQNDACLKQCDLASGPACFPLLEKADACICQACPTQCGDQEFCGGNGAGGTGPANACDTCLEGVYSGACAAPIEACDQDTDCQALFDCYDQCKDEACYDQCTQSHATGAARAQAIDTCLCGQCTAECGSCDEGKGGSGGGTSAGSGGETQGNQGGTSAGGKSAGVSGSSGSGNRSSGKAGGDSRVDSSALTASDDGGCAVGTPGASSWSGAALALAALLVSRRRPARWWRRSEGRDELGG